MSTEEHTHTRSVKGVDEEQVVIAYHANCIDGFTSAWVTHKAMVEQGWNLENIVLREMGYSNRDYTELLDYIADNHTVTNLYVVDFSLPEASLHELAHYRDLEVTILDHHKTAFERYFPGTTITPTSASGMLRANAYISLHNGECGASLCWKYFFPDTEVPALVRYVRDYDLWRLDLGIDTKYLNKYLGTLPKTLESWQSICDQLSDRSRAVEILLTGKDLYDEFITTCNMIASQAMAITLDDVRGLHVTANGEYASQVGHLLAKQSGTFGMVVSLDNDTDELKVSLRSEGDFDVSAIAKKRGGGGHKNAAGFSTRTLSDLGVVG